jgi:hypothetical protein
MCLVSYIPLKDGYLISSNRDESPDRASTPLILDNNYLTPLYYPRDQKGGSWLVTAENGRTVCVLNGAFVRHKRKSSYRLSRGIMSKSYFNYNHTEEFLHKYDFTDIEPFTMVIKDENGVYEFRWDGTYKYIEILDPHTLHLWSSCTLYEDLMIEKRKNVFTQMYNNLQQNPSALIREIHLTGTVGDSENNFVMNRDNRVATISHSYVKVQDKQGIINIENLMDRSVEEKQFEIH